MDAVVIRRIFREIIGGKRANLLAQELNEEGIPIRLSYKQDKGEQSGEKAVIQKAAWTVWQEHERLFQTLPKSDFHQEKRKKTQKQEAALQQKLSRIPADKMKLYESFRTGLMTKDKFLREKELLNRQKKEIGKSLKELAGMSVGVCRLADRPLPHCVPVCRNG